MKRVLGKPCSALLHFFHGEPEPGVLYGVLRLFYGCISLLYLLSLLPLRHLFYGRESLCPLGQSGQLSFFYLFDSPLAVNVLFGMALVNSVLVLFGYRLRIILVLQFLFLSSLFLSPCHADNYGDQIFVSTAFLLMFLPSTPAWPWQARRRAKEPYSSPWLRQTLRLFLCTLYVSSVLPRWYGVHWWDGSALWIALIDPLTSRLWSQLASQQANLPAWPFLIGTWGAIGFEALFPFLIWIKRLRTPLVIMGLLFHLGMGVLMDLGLFPLQMALLLVASLDEKPMRGGRTLEDSVRTR